MFQSFAPELFANLDLDRPRAFPTGAVNRVMRGLLDAAQLGNPDPFGQMVGMHVLHKDGFVDDTGSAASCSEWMRCDAGRVPLQIERILKSWSIHI
jgi:hypothetical protein